MSVCQLNCTECGYNNWQLVYGESTKSVFAVCEECGAEIKVEDLQNNYGAEVMTEYGAQAGALKWFLLGLALMVAVVVG